MNSKIPNLFIVGAAKAGTTALNSYLAQHPNIYMSPVKEPHYFSKDIRLSNFSEKYRKKSYFNIHKYLSSKQLVEKHIAFFEDKNHYLELFREAGSEKYLGEGSNGYLYSQVAANEIYKFNPKSSVIILLRNPVDRAFSHWLMDKRSLDQKNNDFVESVEMDFNLKNKGWGISHLYIELGLYYNQVKRFLDVFPSNQVKIILYEEFKKDNKKVLKEIFEFLNIKQDFNLKRVSNNKASLPKYRGLVSMIKKMNINNLLSSFLPEQFLQLGKTILYNSENIPQLSEQDRRYLVEKYFIDDINKLSNLIKLDLSSWKIH